MAQIKLHRLSSGTPPIGENYLPLSGGIVTGLTIFTEGLSAATLSSSNAILPQYSLSSHNHNYLPLSGGILTGSITGIFYGDGTQLSTTSYEKIGISVDGGGGIPLTGLLGVTYIPWSCTATQIILLADDTGNIEFDILKCSYDDYPTFSTIVGTNKPEIINSKKNKIIDFTNWNYMFNANDILQFDIKSINAITKCTLTIQVIK